MTQAASYPDHDGLGRGDLEAQEGIISVSRASGYVRVTTRVMLVLQSGFELRLGSRLGSVGMVWHGVATGRVCHVVV